MRLYVLPKTSPTGWHQSHTAPGVMHWAIDIGLYTLAWCVPGYLALFHDNTRIAAFGRGAHRG